MVGFLVSMESKGSPYIRPDVMKKGPLHFAPQNELGVVFLFSSVAPALGLRIEKIQAAYPDCVAYQKTSSGEKRIRIEFEYRSSSFRAHKHNARLCDWIVCWEHDWPDVPDRIRVVELRARFGMGFKVWIQGVVGRSQQEWLSTANAADWALSKRATPGDLLLMYYTSPACRIHDVFLLTSSLRRWAAGWRAGECYGGKVKRVCRLESPIFLSDLRNHCVLKTSSFVRCNMQGNLLATEYWPYLYEMIADRNPKALAKLSKYAPGRLN
jgi:hypothetical protein